MGQTAADQLRQVIVPDLLQLVGDAKVQRVSADAVLAYLRRQQLTFDEQLLCSMFNEADFKHEGSLAVGPLTGALQGRFPKRKYGQTDWLALVSVILRRPLRELQDLLAPAPSKSVTFATTKSMDINATTTRQTASRLKSSMRNPAFIKRAPSGEWQTLIRATSQLQQQGTGSTPMMAMSSSADLTRTAASRAGAIADASHLHSTTAVLPPTTTVFPTSPAGAEASAMLRHIHADDLDATAMSIDTPSYARSLGMGQPGFGGDPLHMSQDLAQSMSIDGGQSMHFWDNAAALTTGSGRLGTMVMTEHGHVPHSPSLMMTTSGLKSLDETEEEQQINQDLREGCASFASQQQYQSFVGGLCTMSDMTTHATDNGPSNRRPVLRRKRV